jgi:hypothetical protein
MGTQHRAPFKARSRLSFRQEDSVLRLVHSSSRARVGIGGLYLVALLWFVNGIAWSLLALYLMGRLR